MDAKAPRPVEGLDELDGLFASLASKSRDIRTTAAEHLCTIMEKRSRKLPAAKFEKFSSAVTGRIIDMINGSSSNGKMGGIIAIGMMTEILSAREKMVVRIATCFHRIFEQSTDPNVLELAARALGHLTRHGSGLCVEIVNDEVGVAFRWLGNAKFAERRLPAVLLLREFARNTPTLFNIHVQKFLTHVWVALGDRSEAVRYRAREALSACMDDIAKRKLRWRQQCYERIYETARGGMLKFDRSSLTHGSLLAVGELLDKAREFMVKQFTDTAELVLRTVNHASASKHQYIRHAVIHLLPRLALISPNRFSKQYLRTGVEYVIASLRNNTAARPVCFRSLGMLAKAVGPEIVPFLGTIISLITEGLQLRSKSQSWESALTCLTMVAQSLGATELDEYADELIDSMFLNELNKQMVDALAQLVKTTPHKLLRVQDRLLLCISDILAPRATMLQSKEKKNIYESPATFTLNRKSPMVHPISPMSVLAAVPPKHLGNFSLGPSMIQIPKHPENGGHRLPAVVTALRTLGTFNFTNLKEISLLRFADNSVLPFLHHDDGRLRKEAALALCKLILQMPQTIDKNTQTANIVFDILKRVAMVAISDSDASIRLALLQSFKEPLDKYNCQVEILSILLPCLNDEVMENRKEAITLVGRLFKHNPAYVLPPLRKVLMQLLAELQQFKGNSAEQEESASLLGHLLLSCPSLVSPYVTPIANVLVSKLQSMGLANTQVPPAAHGAHPGAGASKVSWGAGGHIISTIGHLASVSVDDFTMHLDQLLPIIMDALQDETTSSARRMVAVRTLGQLVQGTAYAIQPYEKYPKLLPAMLAAVRNEHHWTTRREVMRTLGILGARDPGLCPGVDSLAKAEKQASSLNVDVKTAVSSKAFTPHVALASEQFYATKAISALLDILKATQQRQHHSMVIQAIMFIFQSLGPKCVAFLPQTIPLFLSVVRSCELNVREAFFGQLNGLVGIVGHHIADFVEQIIEIIVGHWETPSLQNRILVLIENLSDALGERLNPFLSPILPEILEILPSDRTATREPTFRALQTIQTLALNRNLNTFLSMVISSLVSSFEQRGVALSVTEQIVKTINILCDFVEVRDYATRILHPYSRLVVRHPQIQPHVMEGVCSLIKTLGSNFFVYAPMIISIVHRCREMKEKRLLLKYKHITSSLIKQVQERRKENLAMSGCQIVGRDQFQEDLSLVSLGVEDINGDDMAAVFESKSRGGGGGGGGGGRHGHKASRSRVDSKHSAPRKEHKLRVNQENLRHAWNATKRHRREDWFAWIREFSIKLLQESPSPTLRACWGLARKYRPLARELFNAGFVSCWIDLDDSLQDQLIHHLELALQATNIPPEIVQLLLNLVEFMEHQDKPLLMNVRILGNLAERFHAYAKALHYRELEFQTSPTTAIEQLISINNHLQEPQSAEGLLKYARRHHARELKTSWYEKLEHWNEALEEYELKQLQDPQSIACMLARARCLHALGEWDRVVVLCKKLWNVPSEDLKLTVAPLAAAGAWNLGEWKWFETLIQKMNPNDEDGSFFWALHAVHKNNFERASKLIEKARGALDVELRALLGESYTRSYRVIVKVQQLAELEEVICYKKAKLDNRMNVCWNIKKTWSRRLQSVQKKVDVWQRILSIRSLVMSPREDIETWSRYANLCRKSKRLGLSGRVLKLLLGYDPLRLAVEPASLTSADHPQVTMTCLSHLWSAGYENEALARLTQLLQSKFFSKAASAAAAAAAASASRKASDRRDTQISRLQSKCYLKRGQWEMALFEADRSRKEKDYAETVQRVIDFYQYATHCDQKNQRAWHAWALMNYQVIAHYNKINRPSLALERVVPAIQGFFTSIQLQRKGQRLQDILRLLHLWFEHGSRQAVHKALVNRFETISIDVWLDVIPQLIARIQTADSKNRKLVHDLLCRIGKAHPQALIYPLAVASKSTSKRRRKAALNVFDEMRQTNPVLVDQSMLVSSELIRVAILWHELWQEAIEEASRLWFEEQNFNEMYYNTLLPLHKQLLAGPTTIREQRFHQVFGQCLQMAYDRCKLYTLHQRTEDINRAWDYYSTVFKKLSKEVQITNELELDEVSPKLVGAKNMVLAVPGTYEVGHPVVRIASFVPTLKVIDSKQHPRKLKILGSDGKLYSFLLKGHEDLRQDERVMQLFGLINSFLDQDRETGQRDLSIRRYAVIPLSVQSGLIEWVPHCDTLHLLIKDYRQRKKILLNIEQRIMAQMAPDYQTLTLIQKIEVFRRALSDTKGEDLAKVFRLQSGSAESWLARRSNYTRSLAVMSMVGYILGLGDRHPCNLMLCRGNGKIVHIDFGDCFEVAMNREKFPEKIPFRLTRMLENAMEVSGIEGIFRFTCEAVMRVLRDNKESVMAVLEAFVYDPLINWRLLDNRRRKGEDQDAKSDESDSSSSDEGERKSNGYYDTKDRKQRRGDKAVPNRMLLSPLRHDDDSMMGHRGSIVRAMIGHNERTLNTQALRVISRVENKLTGRDFTVSGHNVLDVRTQVQKLILQATSHKNLCQCYIGWCPFW